MNYDGAFPGDNVSGCEYFAWLNGEDDDNYMVLLSTKNLTMVFRPQFMDKFGIDMLAQNEIMSCLKMYLQKEML